MSSKKNGVSRRDVMKTTSGLAVAGVLGSVAIPAVHAAADETIRVALVGCGGRGNGAAENALLTNKLGPIKLVAMADVFQSRIDSSYNFLSKRFPKQIEAPVERRFLGFDGYKKAMDSLQKGDIVILTTPPAFRWVMFTYAIEKGLNVFMEKPIAVDGPSGRKMLKLAQESENRKLKVGVGLMCRHCEARGEMFKRIKDGQIGDLVLLRAYRQAGPTGSAFVGRKPADKNELLYQIQNFHGFLWASGGAVSDFLIHNIDECCWMKDAWPVSAKAAGGRHYRGDNVDQNFDTYSIEYTFGDGAKLLVEGRTMPGCHQEFASYAHGTRGSAVISTSGHTPCHCKLFKDQKNLPRGGSPIWEFGREEPNPYQLEWNDLVTAVRQDRPYNEVKRGAEASLVTAMGRMAAHTGRVITLEQMRDCEHEFAPQVAELTFDAPAPLQAGKDGKYPVPEPGKKIRREF